MVTEESVCGIVRIIALGFPECSPQKRLQHMNDAMLHRDSEVTVRLHHFYAVGRVMHTAIWSSILVI